MKELHEVSPVFDQLNNLRVAAQQGDVTAVPRLRTLLDEHPEIWSQIGDLGWHVCESPLNLAGGNDAAAVESIRRKMQELHTELMGESTSPSVRLLVDQCVIGWVQLNLAELTVISTEMKGARRDHEVQRRLNAIQGRYLRAIKTLAVVRRLLEPVAGMTTRNLKVIG